MFLVFTLFVLVAYFLHKFFLSVGKAPSWWEKHGIKEINADVAGTPLEILLGRKNITDRDDYVYEKMGSMKFCGIREKPEPIVFVKDLDLLKKIFIKDFDHFVDRRDFFPVVDRESSLAGMLGLLKGEEWKGLRSTLSPTFTTGKIRRMMEHFNSVGKDWTDLLKKEANGKPLAIDFLGSANRFTVDVIGKAVFGIDPKAVKDPNSVFTKMAYRIADPDWWSIFKQNLGPRYPTLFSTLGLEPFDIEAIHFFEDIVKQGLDHRKNSNENRNDFQQLLLEARKGDLKAAGSDDLDAFEKDAQLQGVSGKAQLLTDKTIISQSLLFFLAGFLGTSQGIAAVGYLLAAHQDVQDKLRKEVNGIIKKDGTLDYDDLGKLTYLDMVMNETLRKFTVATRLERVALKDYHDPETGFFVKKGSVVVIPVNAIHKDKEHYKSPEKFDPEHFNFKEKGNRHAMAHLPFGSGPRNCIGMRFALVEVKAAIAYLVYKFRIEPSEKTPMPPAARMFGIQSSVPPNLELRLVPI